MSKIVEVKTYYYLLNVVDDLIYSRLTVMGEPTVMTTDDKKECVLYTSLEEAMTVRRQIGIETLNLIPYKKKLSKDAKEAKEAELVNKALLNAM